MGHSFIKNTQSGQIPEGRGTFISKQGIDPLISALRNGGTGVVSTFLIEKKILNTTPLKGWKVHFLPYLTPFHF